MNRKGVTVWELLLVMVIAFFVVIALFSWLARPHAEALENNCLANEQKLMLGILEYSQDNDGAMPDITTEQGSSQTWRRLIFPYVKSDSVFQCPSRRNRDTRPDGLPRSYAANYSGDYSGGESDQGNGAFAGPGSKPVRVTDFKDPAGLIAICEFAGGNTPELNIDDRVRFGPNKRLLWAGHWHGSNYAFADGHVKYQTPEQTKSEWYRDAKMPLSANGMAVLAETEKRAEK